MNIKQANKVCQDFANKHKIVFENEGEVGFGRICVGFMHGDTYIAHNPMDMKDYEPIKEFELESLYAPDGVNAYHKHDCLCVLGHGDEAIIQLATWVKHLEGLGEVFFSDYNTGAEGFQAVISGDTAKAVMVK